MQSMTPKKIGMIVGAVVAIALAIVFITHSIQSSQPHDEGKLGGGTVDATDPGMKAGLSTSPPEVGKTAAPADPSGNRASKASGAPPGAGD